MNTKILQWIYFLVIITFFIFIFSIYFSKDNINKVQNNRIDYSNKVKNEISELPLLKNDTENIIRYNQENIKDNKIKKRFFWNLLNQNE